MSLVFIVMVEPGEEDTLSYRVDVTTQWIMVDRRKAYMARAGQGAELTRCDPC